jgi:hypothetical protein
MTRALERNSRTLGAFLLIVLAVPVGVTLLSGTPPSHVHAGVGAVANSGAGVEHGFTDGWFNGTTVKFFYTKEFFCAQPPTSGAPSQCEVGEDGTVDPRPGRIPTLYVMTPLGFRPDVSTLQCPIVGSCINHPSTIDLSRVFGPGFADVLLPAHSHIIDERRAGWWELEVIGVKVPAVWDQIVAGKSLATVRALQASNPSGITGDIPTNTYLFFDVQPE